MSFILDALRRAEAERQRGQVPGLGTQPAPAHAAPGARAGTASLAWAALGVAAGLVVAGWWWMRPPMPAAVDPVAARVTSSASAASPAAMPASAVAAAAPSGLPLVLSRAQPSLPARASPIAPASAPATAPAMAPTIAPAIVPAAPAARMRVEASAPVPLAGLTADQRRELPPMALGGSIWSESAAQRFVIVNGQIVHEGEAAAPGVRVERILPRTLVVQWRELRIELPL